MNNGGVNLPSLIILNQNGEMRTLSSPGATGSYTLKLKIDANKKHTFIWNN